MKLVLVSPPLHMPDRGSQLYYTNGLLSVAAAWRAKGHDVSIVDAPAEGWANERHEPASGRWYRGLEVAQVASRVTALKPDLIGVTIPFSVLAVPAFAIADALRLHHAPVVAGGHHASVRPDACLEHFDAVVVGEGEAVDPEALLDTTGTVRGPVIKDLNLLSMPARDLVPLHRYFEAARGAMIHGVQGIERWASLVTSRGCPHNCCFCAINLTMGRAWRARSAANVLAEIDYLRKAHQVDVLVIEDDNFTVHRRRAEDILHGIIDSGRPTRLFAPNGLRADTLDQDLLALMKRAGFEEIWISPESGSQRVVNEVIGKRLDLSVVEQVVKNGTAIGLPVSCFFVIGLPGETVAEIEETIAFAKKLRGLGMHRYACGYAIPSWGTRLYQDCLDRGMIDGFSDDMISSSNPTINNPALPSSQLRALRSKFVI